MQLMMKIFDIFPQKEKRYCFILIFYMVIGALLEAIGIGAIFPLISIMGDPAYLARDNFLTSFAARLGIESHSALVMALAGLLIIFYLLKNLYVAWQTRVHMQFSCKNQIYCANSLFAEYLHKPYIYHQNHNSTTLLRNIGSGVQILFSKIVVAIFSLMAEIVTATVIFFLLVLIDPLVAFTVAATFGTLMYGVLKLFRKEINKQSEVKNNCLASYMKWINQGLGSIKETKVLRKEDFFHREFDKAYTKFSKANSTFLFLSQLPRLGIEAIVVSGLLVLIMVKIALGTEPRDIVPLLGVLALAAFRLMPCANRIVNLLNDIKFNLPAFRDLESDLITIKKREIDGLDLTVTRPEAKMPFNDKITIERLSFKYPDSSESVLSEVSFSIPKGSFVGIIGPSGAGKTTFVDILLGLIEPDSGGIKVDGIDINEDIRAWQSNLSYVPQNIYLVDGTIRENIALGIPSEKIDEARLMHVIRMAELHNFIAGLPDGGNTSVGERGVKLSGGQKQRIGIARALYCEPEILVLDEATSSLDSKTEKSITKAILNLKGQITIIAVAHRLSTLENSDFKISFGAGCAQKIE